MMEFPLQNMDDSSPRGPQAFAQEIHRRQNSGGETIWEVVQAGQPIGVIGFAPISDEIAALHGVCFARKHHGTGRPLAAMRMVLDEIFSRGYTKVVAATFADNIPIYKFLKKLGFIQHSSGEHKTSREGMLIDVRIVELSRLTYNEISEMTGAPQTQGVA